jgi:hypothetical protein
MSSVVISVFHDRDKRESTTQAVGEGINQSMMRTFACLMRPRQSDDLDEDRAGTTARSFRHLHGLFLVSKYERRLRA